MSTKLSDESKLQPHQRAVYDEFTRAQGAHYVALHWPPGVGIHFTAIEISSRFYRSDTGSRMLLIVPERGMAEQFRQQLLQASVKAIVVDSYVFRELVDRAGKSKSVWEDHAVYILNSSLLLRPEVVTELKQSTWSFVAISAGGLLPDGKKSAALSSLLSPTRMPLVLWIASQPDELERLPTVSGLEWKVETLRVKELIEAGVVSFRPVAFELRSYALSAIEKSIDALAEKLTRVSDLNAYSEALRILKSEWPSSAAALESAVRRLGRQLTGEQNQSEEGVVEEASVSVLSKLAPADRAVLASFVAETLQRLEQLESDSKYQALHGILTDLNSHEGVRVFILTRFRSTAAYLQAALQNTEWPVYSAHAGMSLAAREAAFHRLATEGGILVCTPLAMTASPMSAVPSALVLYDVPPASTLQRIIGSLRRGSADQALRVCALARPDDLQSISRLSDAAQAIGGEG